MSLEWIQVRVNLADDPVVAKIAVTLTSRNSNARCVTHVTQQRDICHAPVTLPSRSCHAPVTPTSDNGSASLSQAAMRALVIGCLIRLWSLADQHTTDGFLPGYTRWYMDEMLGVDGFCEAAELAGWLIIQDDGLRIPLFDKWFGHGSKVRALAARRQQKKRRVVENTIQPDKKITSRSCHAPVTLPSRSSVTNVTEQRDQKEKEKEKEKDIRGGPPKPPTPAPKIAERLTDENSTDGAVQALTSPPGPPENEAQSAVAATDEEKGVVRRLPHLRSPTGQPGAFPETEPFNGNHVDPLPAVCDIPDVVVDALSALFRLGVADGPAHDRYRSMCLRQAKTVRRVRGYLEDHEVADVVEAINRAVARGMNTGGGLGFILNAVERERLGQARVQSAKSQRDDDSEFVREMTKEE